MRSPILSWRFCVPTQDLRRKCPCNTCTCCQGRYSCFAEPSDTSSLPHGRQEQQSICKYTIKTHHKSFKLLAEEDGPGATPGRVLDEDGSVVEDPDETSVVEDPDEAFVVEGPKLAKHQNVTC